MKKNLPAGDGADRGSSSRMRRRFWLVLGLVLIGSVAVLLLTPRGPICRENYERITSGMTRDDIEVILGVTRDRRSGLHDLQFIRDRTEFVWLIPNTKVDGSDKGIYHEIWASDEATINIMFKENTAVAKSFTPMDRVFDFRMFLSRLFRL